MGALLALAFGGACSPSAQVEVRQEGRLGSVRIFHASDVSAGLVFVFSDRQGWNAGLERAASRIAEAEAVVVGVDLPAYLVGLRESSDGCHYVVAELEDLSHRLEREFGFARYLSPILAGVGAGGVLTYAALAQSPAATVAGAIGVEPAPSLGTRVPLCEGAPASAVSDGAWAYGAHAGLPGFWWSSAVDGAALAHPASGPEVPVLPPEKSSEGRLAALVEAALARQAADETGLGDLPLVELPVNGAARRMVVIYSGDGGWRDLDKDIADVMARDGTPVVGVDSLRYFWSEKTPETTASDLARILRHYRSLWGTQHVVLVGYSFGADILPFAVTRLPNDLLESVLQISLLAVEHHAPFEISVTGWIGEEGSGPPVLPELQKLDLSRVQCLYGEDEDTTLCTAPELAESERIRTVGGHHFDGDYEGLARRILEGADRREQAAAAAASRGPGPPG
jgi:type IV secretory pathway VirJ component